MKLNLLVGSDEFWASLREDIASARESVWVQTLSFEGDDAGMGLSLAMRESSAPDRRIIVDCFTKHFISDRFVHSPANKRDPEHKAEVDATWKMIDDNVASGVAVHWVNPFGFLFRKLPVRNHKKMILIDGKISYIGGINFSDHNFEWHDMMMRIESSEVGAWLQRDFEQTWAGNDVFAKRQFPGVSISLIDGHTNEETFEELFDLIDGAERSIFIESPYLSFPFYARLRAAVGRGVEVTVLMPDLNNRKWVQQYTEWESARSGIELRNYTPKMTHLKAMLIDDEKLVVGSSNFDYLSYRTQQEVVVVVTDAEFVETFKKRVRDADLANSRAADTEKVSGLTILLYGVMRVMGKVAVTIAKI